MTLVTPFWFKQRQAKADEVAPNLVKVTGPNLREALVGIREQGGAWQAFVRAAADAPDLAATQTPLPTTYDAWEAAFELYRGIMII